MTAKERIGTTLAKKYRLDRILGEGGMGVVYAGHHVRLDRRVAVKFLHPQYAQDAQVIARFFSEAQAAARLQHPNVVDVYDVDQTEDDGSVYMVLEYLEGEPLRSFLSKRGRVGRAEAISLIAPVLSALERAHENGIIHRDLKPDNLFLTRDRDGKVVPKVLDFGIAKLAGATTGTSTGQIVGTPAYMAPEQAMGRKEIGPWTDVWSMGVVLYEMLSGRYPFDFTEDMPLTAMVVTVVTTAAHPLAQVWPEAPPHIAKTIDRALAKEPGDRWQSMKEFRAALEGQQMAYEPTANLPAPARQLPSPPANADGTTSTPFGWASHPDAATRVPQRSVLPLLLGGAAVVLIAIGGVVAVNNREPESIPGHERGLAAAPNVAAPPSVAAVPALGPDAGLVRVVAAPVVVVPPVASLAPVVAPTEAAVRGGEHTTKHASRRDRATIPAIARETTPPSDTTSAHHAPPAASSWGTTVAVDDM